MAIQIACKECGSTHVSRDAWADWDVGKQEWVLGAVFDAGMCHRCEDDDASLIELPLRGFTRTAAD